MINKVYDYFRNKTDWALPIDNKVTFFENRLSLFQKIMAEEFPTVEYNFDQSYKAVFGQQITVTILGENE